jgi:hypothetical protein
VGALTEAIDLAQAVREGMEAELRTQRGNGQASGGAPFATRVERVWCPDCQYTHIPQRQGRLYICPQCGRVLGQETTT